MSGLTRALAASGVGLIAAVTCLAGPASGYPVGPPTVPQISVNTTTVDAGGSLTVLGVQFTPHAKAHLTLHSTPVDLGVVTVDKAGSFSARVTIPVSTRPRQHTIQALNPPTGDVATVVITVTSRGVPAALGSGLSATGFAMAGLIAVAVVLLVGGTLMLLAGRVRRPTS